MRSFAAYIIAFTTLLLAGCNNGGGIVGFWDDLDVTVREGHVREAEDRFAGFAELALDAPLKDAKAELNNLFDKLQDDEVSYYIYAGWLEFAFHNLFSPCRSIELFQAGVDRLEEDAILGKEEIVRLQGLLEKDRYNREGEPCMVPEGCEADGAALYLVLDLNCRNCRQALRTLTGMYPEAEHIAICSGHGEAAELPGWKYVYPRDIMDYYEMDAAPFWFLTDERGRITVPYSIDIEPQQFATPDPE